MTPYEYEASGRNWGTLISVLGVWGALVVLLVWVDMAPWLAWVVVVFTLPALYDLVTARASGLRVDAERIHWHAGKAEGEVAIKQIKLVRFDTRLDLSVRVTLVLHIGQKVKIPFEATPPHRAFEDELQTRGLKTERHHFGFL